MNYIDLSDCYQLTAIKKDKQKKTEEKTELCYTKFLWINGKAYLQPIEDNGAEISSPYPVRDKLFTDQHHTPRLINRISRGILEYYNNEPFNYKLSLKDVQNAFDGIARFVLDNSPFPEKKTKQKYKKDTTSLHPGGQVYFDKKLVIEPIGNKDYVYNFDGKKGIAQAEPFFDEDSNNILYYYLKIEDNDFVLDDVPIDKLIYIVPNKEEWKKWANGEIKSLSGIILYEKAKKFIKTCMDLPLEYSHDVATLGCFQTWIEDVIISVFHSKLCGGSGTGKTAMLEVLKYLTKHGVLIGDLSDASMPRLINKQKVHGLLDEIDIGKDYQSLGYKLARQGYRKDNPYVRCNPTTLEPEIFDNFGTRFYSTIGDVEGALETRSVKINLGETTDTRLPLVNMFKAKYGKELSKELYYWYMDNIILDVVAHVAHVAQVSGFGAEGTVHNNRQIIFDKVTESFDPFELGFLNSMRGRNIELSYVAILVSKIFGVYVLENLKKSFKEKQELEVGYEATKKHELVKDILIKKYETLTKDKDKENNYIPICLNQDIIEELNNELKDLKLKVCSKHYFKKILNEFGFIDGVNRKKGRVQANENETKIALCLYFDHYVTSKLALDTISPPQNPKVEQHGQHEQQKIEEPVAQVKVEQQKSENRLSQFERMKLVRETVAKIKPNYDLGHVPFEAIFAELKKQGFEQTGVRCLLTNLSRDRYLDKLPNDRFTTTNKDFSISKPTKAKETT